MLHCMILKEMDNRIGTFNSVIEHDSICISMPGPVGKGVVHKSSITGNPTANDYI